MYNKETDVKKWEIPERNRMNYLVLDLEMCGVQPHYRTDKFHFATEIIQIGGVLLDEEYQCIGEIRQYVHPEHGVIDNFILSLTGISNADVKHAPSLAEAMNHMLNWIGNREYQVIAWSKNDYNQFRKEIKAKEIVDDKIHNFMNKKNWIDYQRSFGERFEFSREVGLEEALLYCEIEAEGRLHDGLCDAINTAKILKKLELHPEFEIENYEKGITEAVEPLNYSLGELFANLGFQGSV